MGPSTDQAANTQAVQKLTVAIWALVAVALLNAAAALYASLPLRLYPFYDGGAPSSQHDAFADFNDLPVEKQIQSASVIAITTYKKEDGKLKSIITSIPKLASNIEFNYKVGDEYARASRFPRENTSYGDGEVIFFTGSPAMMRISASYENGRIYGMGDMPIEKLSQLIAQGK
jgi:hypothetical protein